MENVKKLISISILLFLSSLLYSETQIRKTLVYFHFAEDSGFTNLEKNILEQTLIIQLGKIDQLEIFMNPEITLPEDKDRAALFAGADSWVDLLLSGSKDAVTMEWIIRDVQESEEISKDRQSSSLDEDYLTLYGSFWRNFILSTENALKPIEITGILRIKALEKSMVVGLGEDPLSVDENGLLEIILPAPAVYSVGIQCEGYYPETHRFFLHKDELIEIDAPQKKKSMISLEGGLYMFGFPSLAVNYQIPRTHFYVSLGSDIFFKGLTPGNRSDDSDKPQIFNGSDLIYINAEAGYILESSKGFFRYPFGAGAFIRLTPGPETTSLIDEIAPWGMFISASVDYRLRRNFILFYEWKPSIYFCSSGSFFTEAFEDRYLSLNEDIFLDIPLFILGVRWSP